MKKKIFAMTLIFAMLIAVMSGCGIFSGGGSSSDGESASDAGSASSSKPELADGELLFSGTSSAEDIESITVSFVLSKDKSTLHDFTVFIKNFVGSAKSGNTVRKIEISNMTTTAMNDISIDYTGSNRNISVGDNKIESLKFTDDKTAEMKFTYCYKDTGVNQIEIPVSGIKFTMTAES